MAQPIDERVLRAAQRAVARARGQEVFIEPISDGASPSESAKLYRITSTAEIEPVKTASPAASDKEDTAAHKPVKATDRQRRAWLPGKSLEEKAHVVVPRGSAAGQTVACPVVDAEALKRSIRQEAGLSEQADQPADGVRVPQQVHRGESARPAPSGLSAQQVQSAAVVQPMRFTEDERLEEDEGAYTEIPRVNLRDLRSAYGVAAGYRDESEVCGMFLDRFFAQLKRCGVKNAVVTPGAQSAVLAFKAQECFGDVYVDSDERSAAFFALGLAKATGNIVVLICSGGVSAANWLPAVLEAQVSRIPLLLLTADRPAFMHGHSAAGVCDQLHFFGSHVKKFVQMPVPSKDRDTLAFAAQTALDACIAAHGCLPNVANADAGPVHINFPFMESVRPWKGDCQSAIRDFPAAVFAGQGLLPADAKGLFQMICGKRVVALCGEGTCGSTSDARQLLNFAHMRNVPLLADPFSGLRSYSDSMIIDCYDAVFGSGNAPHAEVVIRFGHWPSSGRLMEAVAAMGALQICVDMRDTRDQLNATDLFVHCAPTVFCEVMAGMESHKKADRRSCREWQSLNDAAARRIRDIRLRDDVDEFEGAYLYEVLDAAPANSLIWCANGTSMAALETFYCKSDKRLAVMGNRGMAGVDGAVSSALGAAQVYEQSTVVVGDVAFLNDVNALALQSEFRTREERGTGKLPSVIVVLMNNGGAAGFDMVPRHPEGECFERLFLNPRSVDCKRLADGFGVTFRTVSSVNTFRRTYSSLLGEPGLNIIEVLVPADGVRERFAAYQRI